MASREQNKKIHPRKLAGWLLTVVAVVFMVVGNFVGSTPLADVASDFIAMILLAIGLVMAFV
jgi:predicted phage tail protein